MPNQATQALLSAVVASTLEKAQTSRKKNIAKGNYSAWRKTWEDALREFYPESVISYPDRVGNNLKQAVAKRGLRHEDVCNFLYWIVANWQQLRTQVFSYSLSTPRGPEAPDLKFVIPNLVQVHASFMRSKPEIAASLPLGKRLNGTVAAPAPIAARPIPKPAPAAPPAPLKRIPINRYKADPVASNAARVSLGLPKWDDK
jgi:hypothetical protein